METSDNKLLSPQVIQFLQRHVNLHRVILLLTLALMFSAWNRGIALLYGLSALLIALLILSYILPFFQLRNLKCRMPAESILSKSEQGNVEIRVASLGTRYHLSFSLSHSALESVDKVFVDYLLDAKRLQMPVLSISRGVYSNPSLNIESSYPFGIFSFRKTVLLNQADIWVLPKAVDLGSIQHLFSSHSMFQGNDTSEQKGAHGEILSLRDWIPGDSVSHVDWKSSARRQELVVKEFSKDDRIQWNIVFNPSENFVQGEANNTSLESVISFILGLIEVVTSAGEQVKLWVCEDSLWSMSFEPYQRDFLSLYKAMAKLEARSTQSYPELMSQIHSHNPLMGRLVTLRLDTELEIDLRELSFRGLTHLDMVFLRNSFLFPLEKQRQSKEEVIPNGRRYFIGLHTDFRNLFS